MPSEQLFYSYGYVTPSTTPLRQPSKGNSNEGRPPKSGERWPRLSNKIFLNNSIGTFHFNWRSSLSFCRFNSELTLRNDAEDSFITKKTVADGGEEHQEETLNGPEKPQRDIAQGDEGSMQTEREPVEAEGSGAKSTAGKATMKPRRHQRRFSVPETFMRR